MRLSAPVLGSIVLLGLLAAGAFGLRLINDFLAGRPVNPVARNARNRNAHSAVVDGRIRLYRDGRLTAE